MTKNSLVPFMLVFILLRFAAKVSWLAYLPDANCSIMYMAHTK
jgi:hypothetical protein